MGPGTLRSLPAPVLLAWLGGPLGAAAWWALGHGGLVPAPAAPSLAAAVPLLLLAPVLEELAFRGALQDLVGALLRPLGLAGGGPVTRANLLTSLAFAACHLPYQPLPVCLAIVLPSLLLGRVREATGRLLPCVLLHAWFNACYFSQAKLAAASLSPDL